MYIHPEIGRLLIQAKIEESRSRMPAHRMLVALASLACKTQATSPRSSARARIASSLVGVRSRMP